MNVYEYWDASLRQDADRMRGFFRADAFVNWHNTNERFSVDEFIQANCEYPGAWSGNVERVETLGSLLITVTHVYAAERQPSFHVTSFFMLVENRIASLDEYWGDDGPAPQWRADMRLGRPIKP